MYKKVEVTAKSVARMGKRNLLAQLEYRVCHKEWLEVNARLSPTERAQDERETLADLKIIKAEILKRMSH